MINLFLLLALFAAPSLAADWDKVPATAFERVEGPVPKSNPNAVIIPHGESYIIYPARKVAEPVPVETVPVDPPTDPAPVEPPAPPTEPPDAETSPPPAPPDPPETTPPLVTPPSTIPLERTPPYIVPDDASADERARNEDFERRATGPGVFKVEGFDDAALIRRNQGASQIRRHGKNYPELAYKFINLDAEVKASGSGSANFTIPSMSPANMSGFLSYNFVKDGSLRFGAGTTFYIQWRQRFSKPMLDTLYKTVDRQGNPAPGWGGWKQIILTPPKSDSCVDGHIVVTNGFQRNLPQIYHDCGLYQLFTENTPWGHRIQNGIDKGADVKPIQNRFVLNRFEKGGRTELRPGSPAMGYYPDEWMTFQIRVSPGAVGTQRDSNFGRVLTGFANSVLQFWVAREGEPSELVISKGLKKDKAGNIIDPIVLLPGRGYGQIYFLPYQTRKDVNHVHPEGHTWVDEAIFSTQRIPDPE